MKKMAGFEAERYKSKFPTTKPPVLKGSGGFSMPIQARK
jgi:hypothetical protein